MFPEEQGLLGIKRSIVYIWQVNVMDPLVTVPMYNILH